MVRQRQQAAQTQEHTETIKGVNAACLLCATHRRLPPIPVLSLSFEPRTCMSQASRAVSRRRGSRVSSA